MQLLPLHNVQISNFDLIILFIHKYRNTFNSKETNIAGAMIKRYY